MQEECKDAFLSSLGVGAAPGLAFLGVSQKGSRSCCPPAMAAGSCCLSQGMMLPMQKQQGIMLPVFPGRSSHSAHQGLVSGRERGGIPIHRGEVLTSVEGSSSFLAAATKFSMNQALGTHHSLAMPQLLIREKILPVPGGSHGSRSLEEHPGHDRFSVQNPLGV